MSKILKPGEKIDDFAVPDQSGTTRRLSELLGNGPVVLFFYPKAMTSGCTAEGCHFRDMAAEFEEAGAQRVGISMDDTDKQKDFAAQNEFDYPLLSDTDGTVADQFGVRRRLKLGPLSVKRVTFVIGTDRTLLHSIHSETNMTNHADEALKVILNQGD
ncbi:peroxiredoxin [Haloglycomyces albus]|uniref:peroxiredoxin n=1 Tax=Haloglycomyces albus TaxID=526067 RepID=UPI00046CCFA6|nr:peroxiredoxin [Haloglycomyces albus]